MEADGFVELHLRPWSLGPSGRTIHIGGAPFGAMNTHELAQRVVEDHNASLEGGENPDRGRVDIYFDAAKDSAGWHTPETP